jgi:hypothetical protein
MLVGCFVPAALCFVVKKVNQNLRGDRRTFFPVFYHSLTQLVALSLHLAFVSGTSIYLLLNQWAGCFVCLLVDC